MHRTGFKEVTTPPNIISFPSKISSSASRFRLPARHMLEEAVDLFFQHFYPDAFFFLHRPSIRADVRQDKLHPILSLGILSLTCRFSAEMIQIYGTNGNHTSACDFFAQQIREELVLQCHKPSLYAVQALLMLALHDWGSRREAQAWIYTGLAFRMGHLLGAEKNSGEEETILRTFWSSYVLEAFLSAGKDRPLPVGLAAQALYVRMPANEDEFLFKNRENFEASTISLKSFVLRAVDVWTRIARWVCSGGRQLENFAPWDSSSMFHGLAGQLDSVSDSLPTRYRYDKRCLLAHLETGTAGTFAFLHYILNTSAIFLNREYLPFRPMSGQLPNGPIEPPFLSATWGEPLQRNFWINSATKAFMASHLVTEMTTILRNSGQRMSTPFVGFSVFTAVTMNIYLKLFPWMDLIHSCTAKQNVEENLRFLKEIQAEWEMGKTWLATSMRLYEVWKNHALKGARPDGRNLYVECDFEKEMMEFGELDASWSSLPQSNNAAISGDIDSDCLIGDAIHGSFLEEGFWDGGGLWT